MHPVKINSERCVACNRLEVSIYRVVSVSEPPVEVFVYVCICVCMYVYERVRRGEERGCGSREETMTHFDFKGDESFQCTYCRILTAVEEINCI
jgi:hypothetical protein